MKPMPITSFSEIRDRLRREARQAYLDFRRSRPDETIYAFGLYTDDDALNAHSIGNTEEAHEKAVSRNPGDGMFDRLSSVLRYRWSPAEWKGIYSEEFPAPDNGQDDGPDPWEELQDGSSFAEAWRSITGRDHRDFRRNMFRAMVDALRLLDGESLFGTDRDREKVILFISLSDSEDEGFLEIESAKLLNPRRATRRALRTIPLPFRWIILAGYYWRRLIRGRIVSNTLSTQVVHRG